MGKALRNREARLSVPLRAWAWLRDILRVEGSVERATEVIDDLVRKLGRRRGMGTVALVQDELKRILRTEWLLGRLFGTETYENSRLPLRLREKRIFSIVKRWLARWIACLFGGRVRVGISSLGTGSRRELGIMAASSFVVNPGGSIQELEGHYLRLNDAEFKRLRTLDYESRFQHGILYGPLALVNDARDGVLGVNIGNPKDRRARITKVSWGEWMGRGPTGKTDVGIFVDLYPIHYKPGEEIAVYYNDGGAYVLNK